MHGYTLWLNQQLNTHNMPLTTIISFGRNKLWLQEAILFYLVGTTEDTQRAVAELPEHTVASLLTSRIGTSWQTG